MTKQNNTSHKIRLKDITQIKAKINGTEER